MLAKVKEKKVLLLVRVPVYMGTNSFENNMAIPIKIVNMHAILLQQSHFQESMLATKTLTVGKVHTRIFTVSTVYQKKILEKPNMSINRELLKLSPSTQSNTMHLLKRI